MKVPVVIRNDYTMFLELHDAALWFHTDVRKWTSEVKVKYRRFKYITGFNKQSFICTGTATK